MHPEKTRTSGTMGGGQSRQTPCASTLQVQAAQQQDDRATKALKIFLLTKGFDSAQMALLFLCTLHPGDLSNPDTIYMPLVPIETLKTSVVSAAVPAISILFDRFEARRRHQNATAAAEARGDAQSPVSTFRSRFTASEVNSILRLRMLPKLYKEFVYSANSTRIVSYDTLIREMSSIPEAPRAASNPAPNPTPNSTPNSSVGANLQSRNS